MSTFLTIIKSILSVVLMLFRYAFYRAISSFLTGLVLFFIAVLMFATFYQAYMPVVSHVKPVYLQFSSDCQGESSRSSVLCTYPEASVFFTSTNKANEERMLMRGQAYKVFLDLEMPPSPTNEKLGMFMVNVKFLSAKGTVLRSSSRSCMLHYESSLVRLFRTIFYSLPLTLGITEEKQKVELNFFDDYTDDSYNPAVQAKVVIMTKQVEIYTSSLRLQASFTGLRYLIFNWPVLFSCIAILGNFLTVTLLYSACVNQFMPSPSTTTNSATPQQQATNTQCQNTTSNTQSNDRSTASTEHIATSAGNDEMANLNVEEVPEPVEEHVASTSSSVSKRRRTRIASVKLKFHRKQPRVYYSGQRRVRKVQITRQEIPVVAEEAVNDGDGTDSGLNEDAETSEYGNDMQNDLSATSLGESSQNTGIAVDGMQVCSRRSHSRTGHVRKRRKADGSYRNNKWPCSQNTTCTGSNSEMMTNNSRRGKNPKERTGGSKENKTLSPSDSLSGDHLKSGWQNFCLGKNWESLKFPRMRRLGMYLQENVPSVSRTIRHCVSDLELSSFEEKRLGENDSPKRSVSASDLTLLGSSATAMSEVCQ